MINILKIFQKNKKTKFNEDVVKILHGKVKEYVKFETEHGILLPRDYKTDPAAWAEVLRDIEYAFDEMNKEYMGKKILEGVEKFNERSARIQKGFEFFGKYLMEMN